MANLINIFLVSILMLFGDFVRASLRAEGMAAKPSLYLSMNMAEQGETVCRLVFVAQNNMASNLENLSVETVIFGPKGRVEKFSILDFQSLPVGKTRVRQFDFPGLQCEGISRVLINGIESCKGDKIDPAQCEKALELNSASKIELLG